MRPFVLFPLLCLGLSPPARAQEWITLDDPGIKFALTARVLAYTDGSTQNFFADGRTLYEVSSAESWGKWWAEGGLYCSTWPPSITPTCYNVAAQGLKIKFTNKSGEQTIGQYIDLN